MKWIPQEPNTHCCGAIAIAVIANISLEKAISVVGKDSYTTAKDLAKALRKLGFSCPNRLKRIPRPLLGIARLRYPKEKASHWVVVNGDKIYDGIYGDSKGNVHWEPDWRITSYLPVARKQKLN